MYMSIIDVRVCVCVCVCVRVCVVCSVCVCCSYFCNFTSLDTWACPKLHGYVPIKGVQNEKMSQ